MSPAPMNKAAVVAFCCLIFSATAYGSDEDLHDFEDFDNSVECSGMVNDIAVRKGQSHYYQEIDGIIHSLPIEGASPEYAAACP